MGSGEGTCVGTGVGWGEGKGVGAGVGVWVGKAVGYALPVAGEGTTNPEFWISVRGESEPHEMQLRANQALPERWRMVKQKRAP